MDSVQEQSYFQVNVFERLQAIKDSIFSLVGVLDESVSLVNQHAEYFVRACHFEVVDVLDADFLANVNYSLSQRSADGGQLNKRLQHERGVQPKLLCLAREAL